MKQIPEELPCYLQGIDYSVIDRHIINNQQIRTRLMGHLKDIGKGYFSHLIGAWKMAGFFAIGTIRCLIHGIIPNLDTECAQNTAKKVNMGVTDSFP